MLHLFPAVEKETKQPSCEDRHRRANRDCEFKDIICSIVKKNPIKGHSQGEHIVPKAFSRPLSPTPSYLIFRKIFKEENKTFKKEKNP